jgi:hypothetical protein
VNAGRFIEIKDCRHERRQSITLNQGTTLQLFNTGPFS